MRLTSVNMKEDNIYLILKNLNPKKADGWDDIAVRMIKLCGTITNFIFVFFRIGGISR